jgi:DNA-binding MarR family transcriptional regulator
VIEIERALNRISYLNSRVRQHDRLMAMAGLRLDRAAVTLLRQMADSDPMRPGELAARLEVEASHVTRQVQQLQKAGYVSRAPDPDDRRAQRIELTPAGTRSTGSVPRARGACGWRWRSGHRRSCSALRRCSTGWLTTSSRMPRHE